MTWPSAQVKTNFDQSSDDPKVARSDLAGNVDKFNQMQAHVSSYIQGLLDDADAGAARTTLGLKTAALKNTGTSGDALALLNASANWSNAFLLSGVISPSQITGNQNNYNPSGLSGAVRLRLNSDASRNVTGLAGGAAGRLVWIANIGATDIVLVSQSASSTAANRFLFAGGDLTLAADESVMLHYDGTTSRWRRSQDLIISGITRETAIATTNGTAHGWTGIAAGANRITLMLDGVSLSDTDRLLVQLGDAGGYETSSYTTGASGGTTPTSSSSGFVLHEDTGDSNTWSGSIVFTRTDGNAWSSNGVLYKGASGSLDISAGRKTLTAELDRIQITRTGSDTFDGGKANILVE